MSCFDPRPTSTSVSQDRETTSLRFTPSAADCGFGAAGKFDGESLVGTWAESSFRGAIFHLAPSIYVSSRDAQHNSLCLTSYWSGLGFTS